LDSNGLALALRENAVGPDDIANRPGACMGRVQAVFGLLEGVTTYTRVVAGIFTVGRGYPPIGTFAFGRGQPPIGTFALGCCRHPAIGTFAFGHGHWLLDGDGLALTLRENTVSPDDIADRSGACLGWVQAVFGLLEGVATDTRLVWLLDGDGLALSLRENAIGPDDIADRPFGCSGGV